MEYPLPSQPFMPTSTYGMDQTFSAPYNPMAPLAEVQQPHDLHFHYDAIAQGVQFHTPAGSPHSTSHSFHEQPPVLSASSESGASVSSSAMDSPSHFHEPWNPAGLGFTSGFEYPGMIAAEKTFVGKSTIPFTTASSDSSLVSPTSPRSERTVFKTPVTPASAFGRTSGRSNSLLSQVVRPCDVIPPVSFASVQSSPYQSQSLESLSCWFPSAIILQRS